MKTSIITGLSRDNLCIALQRLYGYEPTSFDGMSLAEISQDIEIKELYEALDYLGVS
jgi:hypothetical protein